MKPNVLLHVGYHKTATRWLQRHFWTRNEIGFEGLPHHGEILDCVLHSHDFDFEENIANKLNGWSCKAVSGVYVLSHEALSGNPHSGGYNSRSLADRLYRVFPEAVVLVVIREQRDAMQSCYKQYVKIGGILKPEAYFKPSRDGRARLPAFDFAHFQYDRLIAYYQRKFGTEKVLVLPFEQFAQQSLDFVNAILSFCGLGPNTLELPWSQRANKSLSANSLKVKKILNQFLGQPCRVNPAPLLPNFVSKAQILRWTRALDRLDRGVWRRAGERNLEKKLCSCLSPEQIQAFRVSNQRVEKLTGGSLQELGYLL